MKGIFDVFQAILLTCSTEKALEGVGLFITNNILVNHIKLLYAALNQSCPSELTIAALKLLTSFAAQGSKGVRELLTNFDLSFKGLLAIAKRRDKQVIIFFYSLLSCFVVNSHMSPFLS